jgi:hypothetical protein
MAVPDLFKERVLPEIVNVPVGAAGHFQVVGEPAADASASEGTADLDVESGLEQQHAKSADPHRTSRSRQQHQSVRPGLGSMDEQVASDAVTVHGGQKTAHYVEDT